MKKIKLQIMASNGVEVIIVEQKIKRIKGGCYSFIVPTATPIGFYTIPTTILS